jgi:hypothetical protein
MPFIMPEIVIQKVIQTGIRQLRNDKASFDDLFAQFCQDELAADYGQAYLDQIWDWFSTSKIPVIQAWSMNTQRIPCISVHLANETEDESKASFNDYMGNFNGENETGTASFTVMVDLGIHAAKSGDHVLWLYYIVSYILFKYKLMADRFGLKLHTFSASDYSKDAKYMAENIYTRWIRFRCTTQNFWGTTDQLVEVEDLNLYPKVDLEPASSVATSLDVDPTMVDITSNEGMAVSRPAPNTEEDDVLL